MSDRLSEALDAVQDERSFCAFLLALSEDRKNLKTASSWQWDKIEDFLESAAVWGETSQQGLPLYKPPENPWKRCAHIIFSGKIYE